MIYQQGQYLVPGKQYVASFVNGVGAIVAGDPGRANIALWSKGVPWISNPSWLETGSYGDWSFTCAQAIDAQGLLTSMEAVLQTFDPLSGWSAVQMADPGEGRAAANKSSGCSLDNLDACFSQGKNLIYLGLAGLVLILAIKLT
jgi:hypothetical protein